MVRSTNARKTGVRTIGVANDRPIWGPSVRSPCPLGACGSMSLTVVVSRGARTWGGAGHAGLDSAPTRSSAAGVSPHSRDPKDRARTEAAAKKGQCRSNLT